METMLITSHTISRYVLTTIRRLHQNSTQDSGDWWFTHDQALRLGIPSYTTIRILEGSFMTKHQQLVVALLHAITRLHGVSDVPPFGTLQPRKLINVSGSDYESLLQN
jgi:2-iminoacetate synthase ThiH